MQQLEWRPLSDGKIASGESVLADLLPGISDETLTSSSLVVQREASRFSGASPESRRSILAAAAGLGVFDDLTETTRVKLRAAEREYELLLTKRDTLAYRCEGMETAEAELLEAHRQLAETEDLVTIAAGKVKVLSDRLTQARAARQERERITRQIAEASARGERAKAALAQEAQVREAALQLVGARAQVDALEAEVEDAQKVERVIANRNQRVAQYDGEIALIARQAERLRASACPVLTEIEADRLPACAFLKDAKHDAARAAAVTEERRALVATIPEDPDASAVRQRLARARATVREIEPVAALLPVVESAVETLRIETAVIAQAHVFLDALPLADDTGAAERDLDAADHGLTGLRAIGRTLVQKAAKLEGRLEEMQSAKRDLGAVLVQFEQAAADVAALKELVTAWRAVRIQVLENDVIPAVEATANEVLGFFPYGLQIALDTQRETLAGKPTEALDIRVIGDVAESYEGLSGGQRTAVDTALHIAIALVVAQRSATRLSLLFVDEPEGLDERGRAAFAVIVRWLHERYGLRVICASHHADVIEGIERVLVVREGEEGSVVEWA